MSRIEHAGISCHETRERFAAAKRIATAKKARGLRAVVHHHELENVEDTLTTLGAETPAAWAERTRRRIREAAGLL